MSVLDVVRWVLTVPLAGLGLGLIVANADSALGALISGSRVRLVPFLGGVAGALALWSCPFDGTAAWAWAPLVLDPGSLPAAVAAGVAVRRARRGGPAGPKTDDGEG